MRYLELWECFLIFILLVGIVTWFIFTSPGNLGSYQFCVKQGYDSSSIYGDYKPYKNKDYGSVECFKIYVEGIEHEKFNVTKDWRGNIRISGEQK